MCGKVYKIAKNKTSIIMREFCSTIKKHLKALVIPNLIRDIIRKIIIGFESVHEIPYTLGSIDGNHIPIVAPKVDPKSYYYQNVFYSTLIQRVIDAKCHFWDYDHGWVRSIHRWVFVPKK
jgi:hypothetical protein